MIKLNLHSGALSDEKKLVVLAGDDDSDDSDDGEDGILPSAGPTDRRNNQQIHKVTAFCHEQDQRMGGKKDIFARW